jgi:hypothetical protein
MAYTFSLNNAGYDFGTALLNLKTMLVAAGWTVPASGDGNAIYSSSGDVCTASTAGVAAQANSLTNANAWFRLRDPNGHELLIRHANNGAATDSYYIWFSDSAGFVTGSPSATVSPTATDSLCVLGNNASPFNSGSAWSNLATGAQKWDFCVGGADEGYGFYAHGRNTPAGEYIGGLLYDVLEETHPDDTSPIVIHALGPNYTGNPSYYSGNTINNVQACRVKGSAASQSAPSRPIGFSFDSSESAGWLHAIVMPRAYGGSNSIVQSMAVNPYDGNYEVMGGVYYNTWPLVITGGTSEENGRYAPGTIKGKSRLLLGLGSIGPAAMDTDTGKTMIVQRFNSGNTTLWIRWDGSTTPVL